MPRPVRRGRRADQRGRRAGGPPAARRRSASEGPERSQRLPTARSEKLPDLAAELVRLKVDVIVAAPTTAVRAVQRATRTIPIVMAFGGDPIGEGFAVGLPRPGGNITGHSAAVAEITAKRVEFLKAIVPHLSHAALLTTRDVARAAVTVTEAAGRTLGVRVTTTVVSNSNEVEHAFSSIRDARVGGIVVGLALRPYWTQILHRARQSRLRPFRYPGSSWRRVASWPMAARLVTDARHLRISLRGPTFSG